MFLVWVRCKWCIRDGTPQLVSTVPLRAGTAVHVLFSFLPSRGFSYRSLFNSDHVVDFRKRSSCLSISFAPCRTPRPNKGTTPQFFCQNPHSSQNTEPFAIICRERTRCGGKLGQRRKFLKKRTPQSFCTGARSVRCVLQPEKRLRKER